MQTDLPVLLAIAAPNEAKAVLGRLGCPGALLRPWAPISVGKIDILLTGVGKANACGAVAMALAQGRYQAVINLGIAGALPETEGTVPCSIGDVVFATRSVFADEGIDADDGFHDLASRGFGAFPDGANGVDADPALKSFLQSTCSRAGPVATVSLCSGNDRRARETAARTQAIAEAMEGAAVLLAAARLNIPAAEIRVISNTTGDRSQQVWDLKRSFTILGETAERISRLHWHARSSATDLP